MKNRRDGIRVPETDPMHAVMPYMLPNRADNEAFISEEIDLSAINKYLEQKNAANPEYKYTFFHVICAAIAKIFYHRPYMNRFYAGYRLYDRKEITLAFVVKRQFDDKSDEVLSIVKVDKESDEAPIEQIHTKIQKIVFGVRKENKTDGATDTMAILTKLPRPILKLVVKILDALDYRGHYPKSLEKVDPYFASVFLSNLGSIKMNAGYHHLANRGTNSVFVVIGEKKNTPIFKEDGSFEMREMLPLGLTIDERIADGYYFSKTIRLLKKLAENPELLDRPLSEEVEF
ncbi:MAG: 2-oxo acid dehydrogenase subunit E2 [Clostridia bacterium]|nr:2-oxo acid dehydrogenase subunit E2 [Clostridia bacterium]